jgi:hypothetical protein
VVVALFRSVGQSRKPFRSVEGAGSISINGDRRATKEESDEGKSEGQLAAVGLSYEVTDRRLRQRAVEFRRRRKGLLV